MVGVNCTIIALTLHRRSLPLRCSLMRFRRVCASARTGAHLLVCASTLCRQQRRGKPFSDGNYYYLHRSFADGCTRIAQKSDLFAIFSRVCATVSVCVPYDDIFRKEFDNMILQNVNKTFVRGNCRLQCCESILLCPPRSCCDHRRRVSTFPSTASSSLA